MSYKLHGPWAISEVWREPNDSVVIMVTDLIDAHGNVFRDGAYKVEHNGKKVRMFKGETAWSDADHCAYNLLTIIRFGR
jgi:hypothetical protein